MLTKKFQDIKVLSNNVKNVNFSKILKKKCILLKNVHFLSFFTPFNEKSILNNYFKCLNSVLKIKVYRPLFNLFVSLLFAQTFDNLAPTT